MLTNSRQQDKGPLCIGDFFAVDAFVFSVVFFFMQQRRSRRTKQIDNKKPANHCSWQINLNLNGNIHAGGKKNTNIEKDERMTTMVNSCIKIPENNREELE